jgi:signal transduction histidine kinase/ligand-binding sensor domain-containing protein
MPTTVDLSDGRICPVRRRASALLLAAAMLCAGVTVQAADLRNVLAGYNLTSWSKKDGLPSNAVYAVVQDAEGYLWLATDQGVVRFDGVRFTLWEPLGPTLLPDAPVRALLVARDGSLWVGFGDPGGVSHIQNGHVRNYGEKEGIGRGATNMLAEDARGIIWTGNRNGLFSFSGDRWDHWTSSRGVHEGQVYSAYVDKSGTFFVGTATSLLRRREGSERFDVAEIVGDLVRGITEDPAGAIWVTDPRVGFKRLRDPKVPSDSREIGRGNRFLYDRNGRLWVGTLGQGLWRLPSDVASTRSPIEKTTALTGLSDDGVTSLLEDRDGNIWAGTLDGLDRLTPHKLTPIMGLGLVNGLEWTPAGTVWVGATNQLIRFAGGDERELGAPERLPDSPLSAMHVDERGTLWIATNRHLYRLVNGGLSAVAFRGGNPPRQITLITSDAHGGLWLYDLDQGLLRMTGDRLQAFALPAAVRSTHAVSNYTDRRGRLWLAFESGRVAVVDGDGRVQLYGVSEGLDAGVYHPIYEDQTGAVWLGGSEGLSRFADGRFTTVHRTRGFPLESLTAIIEDDTGSLWVGTSSGFFRFTSDEFDKAAANASYQVHYQLYDKLDGSAGIPRWFGNRSAVRDGNGHLWFVAGRGVTVIDPRTLTSSGPPAPVRVERVIANETVLPPGFEGVLPPRTARLEIDYTVLNLTSPLKTRFRYRLEGFDADWIDADTRRQAFYTNLSPGPYRFRVVANNDEGTWAEPGAVWAFRIRPMFYQTPWFVGAGLASIVVAVLAAWRIRTRQLRKQFSLLLGERARLSREIHDTLLQSLVGVALQFDVIANDQDSLSSKARLVRMRKEVEEYIREARQSIWDLRSPKLQRLDLPAALREAGERAAGDSIGFTFTVRGTPYRCSANVEEQLLRIGQEAVMNASRHAHARQLSMELGYGEAAITLTVSDDGVGFNPDHAANGTNGHYGLTTMKERAENIGGGFTVASGDGRGTRIETVVPVSASA